MCSMPSSHELIDEALRENQDVDVNVLHNRTYELMMHYKSLYYQSKVDAFLSRASIHGFPVETKRILREELLQPMKANDVQYSNFMEEASRRISQSFQRFRDLIMTRVMGLSLVQSEYRLFGHLYR